MTAQSATVPAVPVLDVLVAEFGLDPAEAARVHDLWVPALEQLRYRVPADLLGPDGATLVEAGALIGPKQVHDLLNETTHADAADAALYDIHLLTAALGFALEDVTCDVLSNRPVDFAPATDAARRAVENLCVPEQPLDWLFTLEERIDVPGAAAAKYVVGALRAACLCLYLGRRLGLEEAALHDLLMAGLLADLGMVFVHPDALERDRLSDEELARVRLHPRISFRVLARCGAFSQGVLAGVYSHQRNLDGSGYPADGDAHGPCARTTNLASAFNAMLWRGVSPANAVRALELGARTYGLDGSVLKPRYDARLVGLLAEVVGRWAPTGGGANEPAPAAAHGPVGVELFDSSTDLLFFLEQLAEVDAMVRLLESQVSAFADSGRRDDRELRELDKELAQLGQCTGAMGVSRDTDFEEFFADASALNDIEKEASAVYRELQRVYDVTGPTVERLRQRYVDARFREIVTLYRAIERTLDKAKSFTGKAFATA